MFENQHAFNAKYSEVYDPHQHHRIAVLRADQLFHQAYYKGMLTSFVNKLLKRSTVMSDLWSSTNCLDIVSRYSDGTKVVPIRNIRGTESRSGDFDSNLYPTRRSSHERWVNIAALMLRNESLPAVDLVRIGEDYFIRDGHHRLSAAKMIGQLYIDANVTVWQLASAESPCTELLPTPA